MLVVTRRAEKREEDQAKHIERREPRANQTEQPEPDVSMRPGTSGVQDFILAEETGESGYAGDRERGDKHGPERNRNLAAQASHVRHFLVAAHGVNHAASREEQQALEECV